MVAQKEEVIRPFTREEIVAVVMSMHPSKSPRPDGIHAAFYQEFWNIVGDN